MTTEEKDNVISALIAKIGNAPLNEKSKLIIKNADFLKNIDFICVDEINGHDNFKPFISQFTVNADSLHCPFYNNKIKVLNLEFLLFNKTKFSYMYDIGLDTQIVSYITRFISGTLDKELNQVIAPLQIKRTLPSEINVDAYALENCGIDKEFSSIESQSIWSVFYFYNLPMMEASMSASCADVSLREIRNFIKYSKMTDKYVERYYLCYSFLLKIVILHFDN